MSIPESQLVTWAKQGAIDASKRTYHSIRKALDEHDWPEGIDYEVYLQGSYKNTTNIRGDSDVDVVVQLNSTFITNLTDDQNQQLGFTRAEYGWPQFRTDVFSALVDQYGQGQVREGNKSLKVDTSYLPADVVVCLQYRQYRSVTVNDYIEGMTFLTHLENRWIINYPKLHYQNGTDKHARTENNYKPLVRILKNARSYMEDKGRIISGAAPSYFVECLLYNVSDKEFSGNYQDMFRVAIIWLLENRNSWGEFLCQNQQVPLFGTDSDCWSESRAEEFLGQLVKLWDEWS